MTYPPGATNAPTIRGPLEGEIWARCENVTAWGIDWYQGISYGHTSDEDVVCGWEGLVDVVMDETEGEWVGPCGSCLQEIRVEWGELVDRRWRRRPA